MFHRVSDRRSKDIVFVSGQISIDKEIDVLRGLTALKVDGADSASDGYEIQIDVVFLGGILLPDPACKTARLRRGQTPQQGTWFHSAGISGKE